MEPNTPAPRRRLKPKPKRGTSPFLIGSVIVGLSVAVAAAIWLSIYAFKSRHGDDRLVGTWQSDVELTIAEHRKRKGMSHQEAANIKQTFGKIKLTFTNTMMKTEQAGQIDFSAFSVVSKDGDTMTLKTVLPQTNKEETFRIHFLNPDQIRVEIAAYPVHECFKRVK